MEIMKQIKNFILVLVLSLQFVTTPAYSQAEDVPQPSGTRKQMATIVFSGLAGAVLGLSTLSFYGRPQDRLSNIAIGFAIGIITGAVLVTYGATTNPDEFYGRELSYFSPDDQIFSQFERETQRFRQHSELNLQVPVFQYQF